MINSFFGFYTTSQNLFSKQLGKPNLDKPEKLKVKGQRSKDKVKTVDASIKK